MIGPVFGLKGGTPDWTPHTGPCVLDIGLREELSGVDSLVEPGAAWQLHSKWSKMASPCVEGHMYRTKDAGEQAVFNVLQSFGFQARSPSLFHSQHSQRHWTRRPPPSFPPPLPFHASFHASFQQQRQSLHLGSRP